MDFKKLAQKAVASEDMTQNKSFERELPAAGTVLMRLRDYIETGRHQGRDKTHKPALNVILRFELSSPKHMIEIDGKKVPQLYTLRLNKGATAKSGFKKVFNQMNAASGGTAKHFFDMIGAPFMATIYHKTEGEGDKKSVYANLDVGGAFSFKKPEIEDPIAETVTQVAVRELDGIPIGFVWEPEEGHFADEDIIAMFNSLYIDGTREKMVGDDKVVESKNWIQERIMANLEWEGSTTQALTQEHVNLDDLSATAEPEGDVPTM